MRKCALPRFGKQVFATTILCRLQLACLNSSCNNGRMYYICSSNWLSQSDHDYLRLCDMVSCGIIHRQDVLYLDVDLDLTLVILLFLLLL